MGKIFRKDAQMLETEEGLIGVTGLCYLLTPNAFSPQEFGCVTIWLVVHHFLITVICRV